MTGKKKETAYSRGYAQARADMATKLRIHNQQLAQRMVEPSRPQLVDVTGTPTGPKPLDAYERGVLAGAVTANRTMLMDLEATNEAGLVAGE